MTDFSEHFERQYQSHLKPLKPLKPKGLQPKTIDAYARGMRRIGVYFSYQVDALSEELNAVKRTLATVDFIVLGSDDVATEAARNFPKLRALGFTVPKTLDAMIATRCIVSGYELLPADRDFDPFEQHLGRRRVACEA